MKLSTRARYAVRMMIEVARFGTHAQPVSMRQIAAGTGISKAYLDQITIPLRAARMLRGQSGRAGGYTLGRVPSQISVRQIVEAAIGPVDLVECVGEPAFCERAPTCQTRVIWALMAQRIRSVLDEYTLADLVDPRFLEEARTQLEEPFIAADSLKPHAKTRGKPPWKQACGPLEEKAPASERQPTRRGKPVAERARKRLVSG